VLLLLLLLCLMLLLSRTAIAALQCHSSVELKLKNTRMHGQQLLPVTSDRS
jgi:hypothetical protein